MQKYTYYNKGNDPDLECPMTAESIWAQTDLAEIGEDCAKDYYRRHDGWEDAWPIELIIEDADGNRLGTVSVDLEYEPSFCGSVINA